MIKESCFGLSASLPLFVPKLGSDFYTQGINNTCPAVRNDTNSFWREGVRDD